MPGFVVQFSIGEGKYVVHLRSGGGTEISDASPVLPTFEEAQRRADALNVPTGGR